MFSSNMILPIPSFESFALLTGTGRLRSPAPQLERWASPKEPPSTSERNHVYASWI